MTESTPRPGLQVVTTADADDLAQASADFILNRMNEVLAQQPGFTLALSGGRTPWGMLDALVSRDVPWDRVSLFQVDERIVPLGDPDRNLTQLTSHLPSEARIDPMPVELDDLEAAAASYAARIPQVFDLIHLGLGPDGHTASLVPYDPILEVTDRAVAITTTEYQGHRRMTLTYPELDRAAQIMWLVRRESSPEAVAKLLEGDTSIPGGRVANPNMVLFTDRATKEQAS